MSLNFCDLLVVGSDLSGVIAATLLAKRGMNVLVLDDHDDSERTTHLATGLDSRAFKSLISKLTIPESKVQGIQENKVSCQVVLPRNRINIAPSRDLLFKEIDREFPQERELLNDLLTAIDQLREKSLDTLLSFLPISSRKESKQFSKWFRQIPDEKVREIWNQLSPNLQTFLKLQIRFFSRGPLIEPLTLQFLLYLTPENCTSYTIRGGARELKKIFFEKMDYFGGLVHPIDGDDYEIQTKGREIRGLKLSRYSFPTRCRFLLGNSPLQSFYQHLPKNIWSFWAKRKMSAVSPLSQRCLIQFEVDQNVIPEPMKENVVLIDDPQKELSGLNYLELNVASSQKSQNGAALLSVRYDCPVSLQRDASFFREWHQQIESRIKKLIPFSNGSLKRTYPAEVVSDMLFPESDEMGQFMKETESDSVYASNFMFPSPTTPFKNAFLLGPNLLDWLGMEGKILSALKGVDLIWNQESKTKKT